MKIRNSVALVCMTALAFAAHAAEPKEAVVGAIKALKEKGGYSWSTTSEMAGGQFPARTTKGKTEKDGYTLLTTEGRNGEIQAVKKGGKGVMKTEDGWQTQDELRQGGQGQGRGRGFGAGQLLSAPAPAEDAEELLKAAKELKAGDGGVYSAELTEEAAKERAGFFGRGGRGGQANANRPEPKNAKATVKFWVKDGVLAKYVLSTSAKITFQDEDRDIERTMTTQISDVGSTKVEVPEEAKKKL